MKIKLLPWIFLISCFVAKLSMAHEMVLPSMTTNGSDLSKHPLGNQFQGLNGTIEWDASGKGRSHVRRTEDLYGKRLQVPEKKGSSGAAGGAHGGRPEPGGRTEPEGSSQDPRIITTYPHGVHRGGASVQVLPSFVFITLLQLGLWLPFGLILGF